MPDDDYGRGTGRALNSAVIILQQMADRGPMTVAELAEATGRHSNNIVRTLHRHPQLFVQIGERRDHSGSGLPAKIWGLRRKPKTTAPIDEALIRQADKLLDIAKAIRTLAVAGADRTALMAVGDWLAEDKKLKRMVQDD